MRSFLAAVALWQAASALDIEIESYECAASSPVTADIYLEGNDGSARGTFGEQIRLYGDLHLSNVESTGIQDNAAFLTAELSLFSIDFALVNMQQFDICNLNGGQDADQGDQAAYENANCPADGSYSFSVDYVLPSAGRESASWLASGWAGEGLIEIFAQRNENMKIGSCTLRLQTFVTAEDSSSLIKTPSAATTAGIILAALGLIFLLCFYCYCCRSSKRKAKTSIDDDVISSFRRMDDEASKKSGNTKSWVSLGGGSVAADDDNDDHIPAVQA